MDTSSLYGHKLTGFLSASLLAPCIACLHLGLLFTNFVKSPYSIERELGNGLVAKVLSKFQELNENTEVLRP